MFGYGFGVMGIGMVLMALFWIALIALTVWALVRLVPRDRRSDHDAAVEIVRRRYAAGEITDAEYQQALKALG
jgi:putative membrane protein